MDRAISIIVFILGVSFMALIHELGHFLAARFFGIEVEEFGLGLPPRAVKLFTWKGTEFTLNWIPFGAFVRPKGEIDPDVPGGMGSAHPLKRLVVLVAGPFMNLIVGLILLWFLFVQAGRPIETMVEIGEVVKDSPAAVGGLFKGDIVNAANGDVIDGVEKLIKIIQANPNTLVKLDIVRGKDKANVNVELTPKANAEGKGIIGVTFSNYREPISWSDALPLAFQTANFYAREMFITPIKMISGQLPPEQGRLISIVGLGNLFVQARERDAQAQSSSSGDPGVGSLNLMAVISIALGITNLLPVPALDGGRILFLIPELLVGRRIPVRYENVVHLIGFAALMLLMVVIMFQDIINPQVLP